MGSALAIVREQLATFELDTRSPHDAMRAELGAAPVDVIDHLDRAIPPCDPAGGGLSAKARALRAWIEVASGPVEVALADLEVLLELGATIGHGDRYAWITLSDDNHNTLASCWLYGEGPARPPRNGGGA